MSDEFPAVGKFTYDGTVGSADCEQTEVIFDRFTLNSDLTAYAIACAALFDDSFFESSLHCELLSLFLRNLQGGSIAYIFSMMA